MSKQCSIPLVLPVHPPIASRVSLRMRCNPQSCCKITSIYKRSSLWLCRRRLSLRFSTTDPSRQMSSSKSCSSSTSRCSSNRISRTRVSNCKPKLKRRKRFSRRRSCLWDLKTRRLRSKDFSTPKKMRITRCLNWLPSWFETFRLNLINKTC
jgi:hypothetical protein